MNIVRLMQAAFSKDPDEADQFDLTNSPLFCRVDFINQILSQELVNAVDNWHKGTREATGLLPKKCENPWFLGMLNLFLRYSVPVWIAVLSVVLLHRYFDPARLTQPLILSDFRHTVGWLLASLILTSVTLIVFKRVATYTVGFFTRNRPRTRFELTSGDTNRHATQKKKATIKLIKFGLGFLAALTCNLLAAYIFARFYSFK